MHAALLEHDTLKVKAASHLWHQLVHPSCYLEVATVLSLAASSASGSASQMSVLMGSSLEFTPFLMG